MKAIEGRVYGPFDVRTCLEQVADFVAATGDDPDRWRYVAPPTYANTLLFAAAPAFFSDPEVAPYAASVIHGEQSFRWTRSLPLEQELQVVGRVDRVRSRGGAWFVSFSLSVDDPGDDRYLEASSTFLLSSDWETEGEPEVEEPDPEMRGPNRPPAPLDPPAAGGDLPTLPKSASRADLVRYAAATRDWNPIHWDHQAAVRVGLPGVVCHGLLMAAWAAQGAIRISTHPAPLAELRIRFRRPLAPAVAAEVRTTVGEAGRDPVRCDLTVSAGGLDRVIGHALVRIGRTA